LAIVDISTIGWVAKSRDPNCFSFPTSIWPDQQRALNGMGNGIFKNGTQITTIYGPQRGCYIESNPVDAVEFVTHLRDTFGAEQFDANAVIQFDNEPEWWTAQHFDVHPHPFTYDEVWSMTQLWATALKTAHPKVKIMGGVSGGWYGIWCSALDGGGWHCPDTPGPDYLAHNKTFYWPWLLQQLELHHQNTGVCLIDWIDSQLHLFCLFFRSSLFLVSSLFISRLFSSALLLFSAHWYPALNGQQNETDPLIQKQMLQQPRNLWDPTYKDLTNNINPINGSASPAVIRQIHEWLTRYHPSCHVEIAITEYAFGGEKLSTSALALAEVLSIMARERLGAATLFQTAADGSAVQQSFRFYRNFDGKGGQVTGDNVAASIDADVDLVTIYGQHDLTMNTLFVKLFNKDDQTDSKVSLDIQAVLSTTSMSNATLWVMSAHANKPVTISRLGSVPIAFDEASKSATLTIVVPTRSALLVIIDHVSLSSSSSLSAPPRASFAH